jgi:uncharacterized DUF497 family protein
MIVINDLIWDKWNINHIKKHKVKSNEVEEACEDLLEVFKGYDSRLIILGRTKKKRILAIIMAQIDKNSYYVVTARDASRKERKLYEHKIK